MRNKPAAWRQLGYIPDMKIELSPSEEQQFGNHLRNKRLHQALKTILKSFVNSQKEENPDPVLFTFSKYTKEVIIKHHVFIIGDMQGGQNGMFIYMLFR